MFKRTLAVSLAIGLLTGVNELGWAQPIADAPDFRPGDAWAFVQTDSKNGKRTNWNRTIIEIESPERIAVKVQSGATVYYDSALNWLRSGRSDRVRLLARYPLRVGDEWTFTIPFDNPNWSEFGQARVMAYESLQVPAGTYQCFRVEAQSTYGYKFYTEYRAWTRWNCPEVKWLAKEIVMARTRSVANPASNTETTLTSELTKFKPGP